MSKIYTFLTQKTTIKVYWRQWRKLFTKIRNLDNSFVNVPTSMNIIRNHYTAMPDVQDVKLFRAEAKDAEVPNVVLVQQIDYPSLEAIEEALNSSVRDEAVEASKPLSELFDGKHYHYVYEKLTP